MFRPRSLVSLIACLCGGVFALPMAVRAQQNRLFPSQAQAQSSILRNPVATQTRRPPPPPRPDTVALPYNLVWGDTQNRLASLFAGVGAKITNKKTEGQTEVWTVQGLIAPNLQSSLFTFQNGILAALEFDYGQPDWDLTRYNDMMGQFRRLLETKCEKPGEMVSRQSDQPTPDGLKQSLMGYQWSRGDTLVQLFYFSAEDPVKSLAFRSISVHYHYQDPNPKVMPEDAELPVNPNADPNVSPLFGGRAKPESAPTVTPEPTATASPGPSTTPDAAGSPTPSPGGVPAAPTEAGLSPEGPPPPPAVTPTASPPPTPKSSGKKKKPTPKPTPEGDSLPLPER